MSGDYYRRWACQKMIEASQTNIWEGHWACAVLALLGLTEENLVPGTLEGAIRSNLEQLVEEHPNDEQYRGGMEHVGFRSGLVGLLANNGHSCHALGHDVIYASYMLSMLARSKVPATVELFDAMSRLLTGFAASGPGYVTINGDNVDVDPASVPAASTRVPLTPAAVLDLFHAFKRPARMERVDMQLGHILTHGHAIVELTQAFRECGRIPPESTLFTRLDILHYANGLDEPSSVHHQPTPTATYSPLEMPYWEQALEDSRHGHAYKYAYSYLKLHRIACSTASDFGSFSRILP